MKYMIHAVPSRMWYVTDFLVPSMVEQGIGRDEIQIWLDDKNAGNLKSCIDSFKSLDTQADGTWHLQDDVIICRGFAERTKDTPERIICGYCCKNFEDTDSPGEQPATKMWYSFPCIHIPNPYAVEFADWFILNAQFRKKYRDDLAEGKNDDLFWRNFMRAKHPDTVVENLVPNLVDHVDYLLGGSIVNQGRPPETSRTAFWEDEDLVQDLERRIAEYHNNQK